MLRIGEERSEVELRLEEGTGLRSTGRFDMGSGMHSSPRTQVQAQLYISKESLLFALLWFPCFPLKYSI